MQRLFRTLALLMLLSFGGCGPSRTELGYGFYQLDEPAWHIIRRERDDTGEIVDRNWWPSRYEVENYYFLGSTTTGSQILYLLVPEGQSVPSDLSEEEVRAFLHSTIRFVGLNLEHATIEELGTYNDYIAPLGADDPLRRQIDMSLDILVWLSS